MLDNHTHERLAALGLAGMAKAFDDQRRQPDIAALTFEERLGLMIDREVTERDNKRLVARLKFAACARPPSIEDIDLRAPRGLERAFFAKLVDGDWIDRKQNLLITGPTGVGKSWIACALGHKACRDNRSVLYHRMPRLFEALALARGDGRHARLLKTLARVQLLILDDWGLAPLTGEQRRDLLEIVDDRHGADRPSSPARCRSITGTRSSAIRPSPTPSSIVSSTTPTASPSRETACANPPPKPPRLTWAPPPDLITTPTTESTARDHRNPWPPSIGIGGRLRSESAAGIEPSVGSVGDSYDNALAETINGLYKAEVIHRRGPWRSFDAVEFATLEWVDWFNKPAAGAHRQYPASRGRGALLRHAGLTSYGGVTQTKQPPTNPGRFANSSPVGHDPAPGAAI